VAPPSAAALAIVAEALADKRVTAVIAQTLAQRSATNRLLEIVGLEYDGEAEKEDGLVWAPRSPVQQATGGLLLARANGMPRGATVFAGQERQAEAAHDRRSVTSR
jgi:hypothetical protein